jgi:outer membrane protein TolC
VRRTIFLQVKESYIRIASLQKTLDVLHRDQSLLGQVAQITEAHYRLGQGTQQDVLKAQLQMTKLLNEIAEHHRLIETEQALMNKILNRTSGEVQPEDLTESPLTFSSDELLARLRQENPEVLGSQEAVNQKSLQVEMARKDRYPDFSVQYQWEHTEETRSGDDAGGGGDESVAPRV